MPLLLTITLYNTFTTELFLLGEKVKHECAVNGLQVKCQETWDVAVELVGEDGRRQAFRIRANRGGLVVARCRAVVAQ